MEVLPLVLPRIERRRVLRPALEGALRGAGGVRPGDVVAVTSKVISFDEGRLVDLARVRPTKRAQQLARRSGVDPAFARLVLDEADQVFGAVPGAILTLKAGHLIANAGADLSNAPPGFAVAERLRSWLLPKAGGPVGVVVTDSHCEPLRWGTSGVALACAGFLPTEDVRGRQDLFGHTMRITFRALADAVASAAVLVMGEVDESTPAAIVRGAPVQTVSRRLTLAQRRSASIPPARDLFAPVYRKSLLRAAGARGR
jgi:coenzyme F420-0:L-glutamate ligase